MENARVRNQIGICETQPATAEGVRSLLAATHDLECRWAVNNMMLISQLIRQQPVQIIMFDKGFGLQSVIDELLQLRKQDIGPVPVVWGLSVSEPEALRLLQSGARGILKKTADQSTILGCLRTVSTGGAWMEDCVFREPARASRRAPSSLTSRERQVLELVEQGLKNKEIADELGIQPGTVKIHLKHIFEKTGVHGRYGLALSGIRQRTSAPEPRRAPLVAVG